MSHLSTTLRRLGVAAVGAGTLLATPYLGVAPAQAAAASGPVQIAFTSQSTQYASTKSDGVNTTVKLSADVTNPGPGFPAATASVAFSYQLGSAALVPIATDTTAPYFVEWTPPGATAFTEYAVALDAAGNILNVAQRAVTVSSASPSVRITTPADGATIGRSTGGNIIVSGTRSADLPALSLSVQTRDNTSGLLSVAGAITSVPTIAAPTATTPNTWSALVAAPACANTDPVACDVVVLAVANPATPTISSDESTRASMYSAVLSNLVVTPQSPRVATNTAQAFIATVLDQQSQPISGISINATKVAPSAAVLTPATTPGPPVSIGTTGLDGKVTFSATDAVVESSAITVVTGDGTGANQTRTVALTTYNPVPAAVTFKPASPAKTLYATNFPAAAPYYTSGGTAASEYTAATPLVDVCFADSQGNTVDAGTASRANIVATLTRTTSTAGVTTAGATTSPTLTTDQSANPGCFLMAHPAAGAEDQGSDTFTAFVNNDGVPGFQAGGTDQQAAPLTLSWGQLKLTGKNSQGVANSTVTAGFIAATPNGQPFVGRSLTLGATATLTFPAAQPTGTTLSNPTVAVCITSATGACSVNALDTGAAATDTVTVTDGLTQAATTTAPAQIATNSGGMLKLPFRSGSLSLTSLGSGSSLVLQPSVRTSPGLVRPGDVVHYAYTLLDVSNAALANTTATLVVDNGFFTPDCLTYVTCTFTPAITGGAVTGNLSSLTKTTTVTSNQDGVVMFAVASGRESKLDTTATLPVNLTITSGAAVTQALLPVTTTGIVLANAGTVTLAAANPPADVTTGLVPSNGTNQITGQAGLAPNPGTNFVVRVTDQFGNLMNLPLSGGVCPVTLTLTGAGYLNTPGTTSATSCGMLLGGTEKFRLDSDDPNTTGAASTVTASWTVPVTVFQSLGTTPASFATVAGTPATIARTGTVGVTLYAIDDRNVTTVLATSPTTPSVAVNTPVTTTMTVTDQKGTPRGNMRVEFFRSGPSDASGNPQNANVFGYTSSAGVATYTYTSTRSGTATVTMILTNIQGAQLFSGATSMAFTGGPAPSVSPTATATATATPTATPSGSPAPTSPPTTGAVTISGGNTANPLAGSTFTISGQAPADAVVTLYFHKAGTPSDDYSIVRMVTADAGGAWSRPITANVDYRYYASAGAAPSNSVLFQPAPTVSGPATRAVPRNRGYTVSGLAVAGSTVFLHFHKPGTPADDYSIVRTVTADGSGRWSRPYIATVDYRLYVSRNANDPINNAVYLIQAR